MWKNKILIFNWTEIDKIENFPDDRAAAAIFVQNQLDELGEESWEPYQINDEEDDATIVFLKRWEPAE